MSNRFLQLKGTFKSKSKVYNILYIHVVFFFSGKKIMYRTLVNRMMTYITDISTT